MRLLVLMLGRWLGRFGERLQARALKGAAIVPSSCRTEPAETTAAHRPPEIRPPDADTIDRARAEMAFHDLNRLKICRGSAKGCVTGNPHGCTDCYVLPWWDKRSSAEILQAMERGDA